MTCVVRLCSCLVLVSHGLGISMGIAYLMIFDVNVAGH